MKIGIDASRANLETKTGVEWYSYNLIEALKNADKENQYFLYSQNELKNDLTNLPDNFYSRVLDWNKKSFWTQTKLWWHANIDGNKILFIPSGMIPVIPFRFYKLITTIHDVCFLDYPQYYSKQDLFIQKLALKLGLFFSNKIITVSEYSKSQIIKHTSCNANKIEVVHLGYDKNIYKKIDDIELFDRMRKKYNLPNNFILFIGRIEEKKNIVNQIKAFDRFNQKYQDYKFVLVGKPGYGYDNVKTEIFENELHKNIIELGYVSTVDMVAIINMSKIFMFVSNYEGFGLPIIEAMACGVPVITSNNTSMPEIAGDAAFFIEPNNVLGIYEKLCSITENSEGVRDDLIKKGFNRVKEFSWKKCAKKTIKVFENFKKK